MRKRHLDDRYFFPAVFTYVGERIDVSFPDLENVKTSGKDEKSALIAARTVLGRKLFDIEQKQLEIPCPSALHDVAREENQQVTLIDVYMPSVRMAENNRSVNRMISLPAWLNAAAMERDVNFSQTLQEVLKREIFHDITN